MTRKKQIRSVFLVMLMVLYLFSMSMVGFTGSVAAQSEFQEVTDDGDLQVWERTVLPLRTDTDDAAYSIENHRTFILDPDQEQANANRDEIGVFESGDVNISYRGVGGANTNQFADEHGQLIVASFDENRNTDDVAALDELSYLVDLALDGELSQLQTEADDRDISFEIIENKDPLFDGTGEFETILGADDPGPYAVMAVRVDDGQGFDESGGTLELPGKATIVGVEAFTVQQGSSTISAPGSVEPGDDIEVSASTDLDGEINHTVVVYDEEKFTSDGEQTNINVTEGSLSDFSSDDIIVEHTIADVNGVKNITDDGHIFGTEVSARMITGTTPLGDIIDNLNEKANTNIQRNSIGTSELDASGVLVSNGASSETISVGTFDNWSESEYRIVHVADNGTVQGLETNTATLTIKEEDDPSTPTRRRRRPADRGPEVIDPEEIDPPADVEPTRAERATIAIGEATGQARVTFTETSNTESITFTDDDVEGDVTVEDYDTESEETGPSPGASVSVSRITVPDPDRSATIRTRVSTERLEQIDADADELRMNRFSDGEWQGLETEVVDETDQRVVLEAETPGFSWFSVSAVSQPEVAFDVTPAEPVVGEGVAFDASDSDDRHGEITSYEWSIDGEEITGETVTYTFDDADEFEVTLTVENDAGETDSEQRTVTVTEESVPESESESETESESESEPVEGSSASYGFAITLIVAFLGAVLVAVLWFRRQQEN